jgi:hypothetical protein
MSDQSGSTAADAGQDNFDQLLGDQGTDFLKMAEMPEDAATASLTPKDESAEAAAKAAAEAATKAEAEAKAKVEADAKAQAAAKAADEAARAAASAGKEQKVDGVLAKDGKHVLPYSVLQAERDARAALTGQVRELTDAVTKLQSGKSADTTQASALAASLRENLEELKSASPELADTLSKVLTVVDAQDAKLKALEAQGQRFDARERNEQAEAQREVRAAIDGNPKLLYSEQHDTATFNRLAAQDAILRNDPANADLSFSERFDMAIKMVEAAHGEIKVPDEFLSKEAIAQREAQTAEAAAKVKAEADAKAKAEAEAKAKAGLSGQDAEALAKAALAKVANTSLTLTDIPGGKSPTTDDSSVVNKSADQLAHEIGTLIEGGMDMQTIAARFI